MRVGRRVALAITTAALLALPSPARAGAPEARSEGARAPDLAERIESLLRRGSAAGLPTGGGPRAASTGSADDPLLDTIDQDGADTVEPRADIQRVALDHGADVLRIAVTVPGGVDPTTDPGWQQGSSGIVIVHDVNGDGVGDHLTVLVGDGAGGLTSATIDASDLTSADLAGSQDAFPVCTGSGAFEAGARRYVLGVPSPCLGGAYEVRSTALLVFDRAPADPGTSGALDVVAEVEPVTTTRNTTRDGSGYRFVAADGGIFSFGSAGFKGSTGGTVLNRPVRGMEVTPTGLGYWLVASDGGIFSFGDARFLGSTGGRRLNQPIVGMAATPTGAGYWLAAADGGIFTFGDAGFFGSAGGAPLDAPVVSITPTPRGLGYWLLTAAGTVVPFGDARDLGGSSPFDAPSVDLAATPSGDGYWLARADGSVLAFGDARALGDLGAAPPARPIVGIAGTPTGRGFWLVGSDGGIFSFGDARFLGSTGATRLNRPIVGMSA